MSLALHCGFLFASMWFMTVLSGAAVWFRVGACVVVSIVLAAGLSVVSAGAADGQNSGGLDVAGCSDGTFVTGPQQSPALVADCQALVSIRNFWLSHPDNLNPDGQIQISQWGRENSSLPSSWSDKDIRGWGGVNVVDGRVVGLDFDCRHFVVNECGEYRIHLLRGPIPAEIGDLTGLKILNLLGEFYGPVPSEIGNLVSLEDLTIIGSPPGLEVGGPVPSGPIPAEIGNLTNLSSLHMQGGLFGGSIPAEIGNLTKLGRLSIEHTNIDGPIPAAIGNLTGLGDLHLRSNRLSGSIPPEIGKLTRLDLLWLDNNELTGLIPAEIGQLSKLRTLMLGNNKLTGHIPAEIGQLSKLETLDLGHNELTGSIPIELSNLKKLIDLTLNNNDLSGSIPKELGQMPDLGILHVENNRLRGRLPPELGNLDLSAFYFCGNDLEGPVPEGLRNIRGYSINPNPATAPAAVVDRDTGIFVCPETWRVSSVAKTAKAVSELLATLGPVAWSWDAQHQIWSRLAPSGEVLSEGTAVVYRSLSLTEQELEPLGLSTTDRKINLTLQNGWNVLSAPVDLQRIHQDQRDWLIHNSLIDCDDRQTGVVAVLRYSNLSGYSAEMPCYPNREARLIDAGYLPFDYIRTGDFIYIYFRSLLPINIKWDLDSQTYRSTAG